MSDDGAGMIDRINDAPENERVAALAGCGRAGTRGLPALSPLVGKDPLPEWFAIGGILCDGAEHASERTGCHFKVSKAVERFPPLIVL